MPRHRYPFDEIEPKWQAHWDAEKTFAVPNPGDADFDPARPKYYVLDMFPYPSGSGLHVGHPEGYTATDIVARYKRMKGFNVLHPMGWDAFGLPAEQYAIKTGQHPRITTEQNVSNFRRQLKRLGFSYDWDREVNTTDPGYMKWTQWIFLQLYHSYFDKESQRARPVAELEAQGWSAEEIDAVRLAFVDEVPVNWSPDLGTVLANEEVEEWKEKGHTVERRPLRQWMLRITAYAQRLLDELEDLDWPESIKLLQQNWIGRSEGAEVTFRVKKYRGRKEYEVTVFTTRPDTLFGATYMVLSPEHPLVDEITTAEQKDAVDAYRNEAATKSDLDRTELNKGKTGVFTGGYGINPVNDERIPVWIADYVLMTYGTGAIMAVPAHDQRDFEFAQQFEIPIKAVVQPPDEWIRQHCPRSLEAADWTRQREVYCDGPEAFPVAYGGEGTAINSRMLDGMPTAEAKKQITRWLEENEVGRKTINYKLRDWLFSRQRYWGEPFPIVWEEGKHQALPEAELPLLQPELEDFKPTGSPEGPLVKATEWIQYSKGATRETNTMPQWAGSCWYYLRYMDAQNPERFVAEGVEASWSGRDSGKSGKTGAVDLYVGGTEHAVLHLLYARFWHKVLFDLGHVSTPEPFHQLVNQGLILGEMEYFVAAREADGSYVSLAEVREEDDGSFAHKETGDSLQKSRVFAQDVSKEGEHFVLSAQPEIQVMARSFKMSKSRGNVVNPDDVIEAFGADSLRLFELFMGPLEQVKPWSTKGVEGVNRFLAKVWRLVMEEDQEGNWVYSGRVADTEPNKAQNRVVHETIKKVTHDIEAMGFNTAIAQMMVCTKELGQGETTPLSSLISLLTVLNPFAPHLTEELNAVLKDQFGDAVPDEIARQPWPEHNESYLVDDEVEMVIQVNGKLRDRMTMPADASKEACEEQALASDKVQTFIEGKTVRKVIVVPKKLVNIVAN